MIHESAAIFNVACYNSHKLRELRGGRTNQTHIPRKGRLRLRQHGTV